MIRFSVCIDMVFKGLPVAEQIAQSAACGASAIEFWSWRDKDLSVIACAKESVGVNVAGFGGLGELSPNDPAVADVARAELLESLEAARQIGAAGLVVYSGPEVAGVPREKQMAAIGALLSGAAPSAKRAHVTLLLEPRNARLDWPGNLLTTTADACAIVRSVNHPNVRMLFDVYHQYVTEGSVLHSIEANIGLIGHFHVADVPGRGEPGTGAVDFPQILRLIDSLGFGGYVGLEYRPTRDPAETVRNTVHLI